MNIRISWSPPTDNFKTVTAYQIEIEDVDGTYIEDVDNCDGSNDLILTQMYCDVPVKTSLRLDPYFLTLG